MHLENIVWDARDPQRLRQFWAAALGSNVEVMEPAFPSVATTDPVREAVELLTGEGQALIVTDRGRPVGIVTRTDLLESLVS